MNTSSAPGFLAPALLPLTRSRSRRFHGRRHRLARVCGLVLLAACAGTFGPALNPRAIGAAAGAATPATPAAKVTAPSTEANLVHLTLTPEAEKRLGITTALVEQRALARTRLFGGEIILPARATGATERASQSVLPLLPALGPTEVLRLAQAQIDADGQVELAQVQVDAAKVALARAEQLLRDKAGTVRTVDEAKAQVSAAESSWRTAVARRELLGPAALDPAGVRQPWVRVPVPVDEFPKIDTTAECPVGPLSGAAGQPGRTGWRARPVNGPASANAGGATIDLYLELTAPDSGLRPGQRVGVQLPLRETAETLVVPASAIIHDAQGGAWVYEKTATSGYTRRRVQLLRLVGTQAALAGGLRPGAPIVTTGVAELFGTEFGAGH